MKARVVSFIGLFLFLVVSFSATAQFQERELPAFSEVTLRIPAQVYIHQGNEQHVELVAKQTTLDEIITEVRDRRLVLRFPGRNQLMRTFEPGKITIHITMPEITALTVAGDGDIIAEEVIHARIIDLSVNGSGNIRLDELHSDRVKVGISGSGEVIISGGPVAQDMNVTMAGSGNYRGLNYPVKDAVVRIGGSGSCYIQSRNNLHVRILGSGSVFYKGNPLIDQGITGSGTVREAN